MEGQVGKKHTLNQIGHKKRKTRGGIGIFSLKVDITLQLEKDYNDSIPFIKENLDIEHEKETHLVKV